MKFIALDVNVGDSFILMTDNNTFIVDGGKSEKGILSKLYSSSISNVNVLICTHYDADHLNGIIGIAKSSKIHYNEIWLPDIFGDIALTISKNEEIIFEIINNNNIYTDIKHDISLSNYLEKLHIDYEKIKTNTYESLNIDILEHINNRLDCKCIFLPYFKPYITLNILKKIITLIIESVKSGAHIRWLKYVDKYQNNRITSNYDLYALNSHETTILQYNKTQLLNALYCLTIINKESLVFLYNQSDSTPNILFTSDSDFSFMSNNLKLNDYSIFTAPHHGSHDNRNVYGMIKGNNILCVRCDSSQTVRPCNEYLQLPIKYCTICRTNTIKKPVILQYINGGWNTNNNICQC